MNEKLSALLDGELSDAELRDALAQLARDPAARRAWERYHLMRAMMRGEVGRTMGAGFADRVAARLPALPQPSVPRVQLAAWRGGLRYAGGFAIAASVAAVALFNLNPVVSSNPARTTAGAGKAAPVEVARRDARQQELDSSLNAFLVEHSEFTAASGVSGVMSYARFVSHDTNR